MSDIKTLVEKHMATSLKEHFLEEIPAGEKIRAFYIKREGTRMMSTLILFTPEGIVLMGDLCPSKHGACSAYGYGLDWFASKLSEDYLCEKFLHHVWQLEVAKENCEWQIEQAVEEAKKYRLYEGDGDREDARRSIKEGRRWQAVLKALGDEGTEQACYDEMGDQDLHDGDYLPGYAYPRSDAGWLCAIQQKFSELYWAKQATLSAV